MRWITATLIRIKSLWNYVQYAANSLGERFFFRHNARSNAADRKKQMSDWVNAIVFGIALIAFVIGMSSIIMGFVTGNDGENVMQERIEYGFFGVSSLVLCLLMGYLLA